MQKKLNATVEPFGDGKWAVYVIDRDTEEEFDLVIEAPTEKEAAFKAMEQINDR
jgi:3,4-dihydroxy-2-butanone 4-phosphate synthase